MRVGLLAFENKEDKEGCIEKGISEKKNFKGEERATEQYSKHREQPVQRP